MKVNKILTTVRTLAMKVVNTLQGLIYALLKAHKLVLASNSKWFHDKFKDSQSTERCDIYLFNTHHHVLRAFVNVLYGEETLFPSKDQKRLIFLLSKFGVKWEHVVDKKVDSAKDILKRPGSYNPNFSYAYTFFCKIAKFWLKARNILKFLFFSLQIILFPK